MDTFRITKYQNAQNANVVNDELASFKSTKTNKTCTHKSSYAYAFGCKLATNIIQTTDHQRNEQVLRVVMSSVKSKAETYSGGSHSVHAGNRKWVRGFPNWFLVGSGRVRASQRCKLDTWIIVSTWQVHLIKASINFTHTHTHTRNKRCQSCHTPHDNLWNRSHNLSSNWFGAECDRDSRKLD